MMKIMANDRMMSQMHGKDGYIAALDQSGGSTVGRTLGPKEARARSPIGLVI